MKKEQRKIFQVQAEVTSVVTVAVPAETLTEALETAKKYTTDDFLYNEPGDVLDQEHRITGVHE
jgi:hypothetical protein